jgi:hypothetical protein
MADGDPSPPSDVERALEEQILALLDERGPGKTICPSDAARAVFDGPGEGWRGLMEPARRAAGRLVAAGEIVVTQGGAVVEPEGARGPIRLRRVRGDLG